MYSLALGSAARAAWKAMRKTSLPRTFVNGVALMLPSSLMCSLTTS